MLSIIIPLLIAIIGLLMYALAANPKLVQIGYAMFCVGLLWTVYLLAGRSLDL